MPQAPTARQAPGIAIRLNEQVAPESSNPTEQPTTAPMPQPVPMPAPVPPQAPTTAPMPQPVPMPQVQPTEKLKKKKWYTRIFNFLSWLVRIILCNSVPNEKEAFKKNEQTQPQDPTTANTSVIACDNPKRKQEIEKLKDEQNKLKKQNQKLKDEKDKLKKLIAQAIKQRNEQDKLKKLIAQAIKQRDELKKNQSNSKSGFSIS